MVELHRSRTSFKLALLIIALVLTFAFTSTHRSSGQSSQDNRQLQRDSSRANTNERRTALVIGNGAYTNAPPLKNPPNDATLVSTTLKKVGFEVTLGTNRSQREMKQLIREFGQRLRGTGGVGLFYFAGHGVQSRGHNYLIPVDADIQNEPDVEDVGVDVNYVLSMMDDAQSALNIVILDACRNNPFARSFRSAQGGLAQVKAPTGTLIAYATAPDSTAADGDRANSPYTEELTKQMETPGVVLETMFRRVTEQVSARSGGKQEPWVSDNHKGEFYFNNSSIDSNASNATNALGPTSISDASKEQALWEAVKDSNDSQDLRGYIAKYPNGAYLEPAQVKLRRLESAKSSSTDSVRPTEIAKTTDERRAGSTKTFEVFHNGHPKAEGILTISADGLKYEETGEHQEPSHNFQVLCSDVKYTENPFDSLWIHFIDGKVKGDRIVFEVKGRSGERLRRGNKEAKEMVKEMQDLLTQVCHVPAR